MDNPERFEQLIAFLDSHLSASGRRDEHPDGSLQFVGGDPPEVVVLLTETSVVVAMFAAEWRGGPSPSPKPRRVGILKWRRLPETILFNALGALIKGAREARRGQFRTCQDCGRNTPPEWMDQDDICRTCAEQARRRQIVH